MSILFSTSKGTECHDDLLDCFYRDHSNRYLRLIPLSNINLSADLHLHHITPPSKVKGLFHRRVLSPARKGKQKTLHISSFTELQGTLEFCQSPSAERAAIYFRL